MFRKFVVTAIFIAYCIAAYAQDVEMSVSSEVETDSVASLHFWERGLIGKVYDYFCETNKDHSDKRFDISFIGGPHFSSEQGFGIGLVGSGRYRASDLYDDTTPYSNVSLKFDVTTGQMYQVGAEGYHIFKHDRFRINYDVKFYSFADKMWGIGYYENCDDANESDYDRLQASAKIDFVARLREGVFIGPAAIFNYTNGRNIDLPGLLHGQNNRIHTTGLGLTFVIDTRDMPTAATRGLYLRVYGIANPRFMANKYRYEMAEMTASVYRSWWSGGVLAGNFHTRLTWGNTPWCQLSYFGGSKIMRGYWEERFRDKMESDVTVELRQHVYGRHGFAVWVGAGTVYQKFKELRFKEIMPNYGLGYRWEFKKGVNVRLDMGFGKWHEKGVNFSINEAF